MNRKGKFVPLQEVVGCRCLGVRSCGDKNRVGEKASNRVKGVMCYAETSWEKG